MEEYTVSVKNDELGEFPHRFVLVNEDESLTMYAAAKEKRGLRLYSRIAEEFGYDQDDEAILGGGELELSGSRIRLYGSSHEYGAVPYSVLCQFADELLDAYAPVDGNLDGLRVEPETGKTAERLEDLANELLK